MLSAPHEVPLGLATVVSVHVGVPWLQDVCPTWQGLATEQSTPARQLTHAPELHTPPSSQTVPFWTLMFWSAHP
jgi:hypothetical protein